MLGPPMSLNLILSTPPPPNLNFVALSLKLRSTMLQNRLQSLSLISCEKYFSHNLSVIKKWVQLKNRKVRFSVSKGSFIKLKVLQLKLLCNS